MRPPAFVSGVGALAGRYDGFILDMWGVLHNGQHPYPGVVDCLERLKQAGKRLVVLSNAPRRVDAAVQRMEEIGIPRKLLDGVMTSGEDAWRHLRSRGDPWYARLGRACFHQGGAHNRSMLEGQDMTVVTDIEHADFILCTGADSGDDKVEAYAAMLESARARGLPMICANPDLVVVHYGRLQICAGSLAQRYEAIGGEVRWHGKPHRPIYDACFDMLGVADRRRILAVGDSFRTDLAGAQGAGIDGLFVAGGIHGEELGAAPGAHPDLGRLTQLIADSGIRPAAVVPSFLW
ncbi:MAG: TIGR01459 family HAD-type hydrolase [Alphaproteobacteria bacterium]|nr:TIGR01459 family HAD-type hydrolase [Alphaproteobacteria bacterium]